MCILISSLQIKYSVAAFYLLSGSTLPFLKATLNPDPVHPSAWNPSQPDVIQECYKHTSIFQIMTENIASFPQKATLLIYHTLLHYLDQWRDENSNLFQASFSVKIFRNATFIW